MISVITPTFNRAYSLGRLYSSLESQTNKEFEWIVINDGSTDDTDELINSYIIEGKINIIYIRQENLGKHKSLNKAIKIAKGDLVFFVDSDDYLTDGCIEFITTKWEKIKKDKSYAGLSGSCNNSKGESIGDFGKVTDMEYVDATAFEYRYKYKVIGDKAEVFRRDIMQKYMFPEFEDEKFIPEATVYNRIANDGYKLRWFKEPIYVCEYRTDGLTAQGGSLFSNSWNGYSLYLKEMLAYNGVPIILKLKLLFSYLRISKRFKKPLFKIVKVGK